MGDGGAASSDRPSGPPVARQEPFEHTEHGHTRPDPYQWMRRLDGPVLDHLAAEREWYDVATGHLGPLVQELRAEMSGRVPATDSSVSWTQHGYSYYTVLPPGREYVQLLRRRHGGGGPEELLLDANEMVGPTDYVDLGHWSVSPDAAVLAYCVDHDGDEEYQLRFRDLATGRDLEDAVPRAAPTGAWSADSSTYFYVTYDDLWRQHQVWRHRIGTPVADDVLVIEDPDEQFEIDVTTSRTGGLVVIWSESRNTSEVWVLDANDPEDPPHSVGGRRRGIEYHAEHLVHPDGTDELLVVTNDDATEFRLARSPVPRDGDHDHSAWRPLRPEEPAERLRRADAFAGHVVLTSRTGGHNRLRILTLDDLAGEGIVVDPVSEIASLVLSEEKNVEPEVDSVIVVDESYLLPQVWSSLSLETGERTDLLRKEAPGFDPGSYVGEKLTFPSADGTPVSATVVRRRSTPLDGSAPCVMWSYGAYEESWPDQEWDPAIASLLDRGVVYVHAHVRGGGEGGRRWWLDGRMEHKQHTFDDHIAVADGLASAGLVDGSRIVTRGLSAGGLLAGAVFTQRPDRWRAVVAEVPFVDVLTTMLDPTIPLTIGEWDEWGDPSKPAEHAWMAGYSPYDNPPPAGGRPDLLATGAVHDARVMVWEPAKWVARLRETDPDWAPRCLFRVETGAGAHVGPAGRFAHLGYDAEVYAWILDRLDVTDSRVSSE